MVMPIYPAGSAYFAIIIILNRSSVPSIEHELSKDPVLHKK